MFYGFLCFCFIAVGMVKSRVGADIRSLYAICEIDDYELLKKEIAESNIIFTSMSAVIKERLKIFKHSSPSQVSYYRKVNKLGFSIIVRGVQD